MWLRSLSGFLIVVSAIAPAAAQDVDPMKHTSFYAPLFAAGKSGMCIGVQSPQNDMLDQFVWYGFNVTEQMMTTDAFQQSGRALAEGSTPIARPYRRRGIQIWKAAWDLYPPANDVTKEKYGIKELKWFDPGWREYNLDYQRAVSRDFAAWEGENRYVWGWTMQNEHDGALQYNGQAAAAFYDWLSERYSSVDALNDAWGTAYESIEEVVPPQPQEFNNRQGAWLDWHTFQDVAYAGWTALQCKSRHEADPKGRPCMLKNTELRIEFPRFVRDGTSDLDMISRQIAQSGGGWACIDDYGSGDSHAYEANYLYNASGGARTIFGETNNHSGPGYVFSYSMWPLLGNGIKGLQFFCWGGLGSTGDYDTFGMHTATGLLRPKMVYAAKLAHQIHRMERFWSEATSGEICPKVAIFYPRRDMLLEPDSPHGTYGYGVNNRIAVYSALRQQQYVVDVITRTVLLENLDRYQALLLVGAMHLSQDEAATIETYVRDGGVLIADARTGFYDQVHREKRMLSGIWGEMQGGFAKRRETAFSYTGQRVLCLGQERLTAPETASVLGEFRDGKPALLRGRLGRGQWLYLATQLGARSSKPADYEGKWQGLGQADGPAVLAPELLRLAGVQPAYHVQDLNAATRRKLRIEQPMVDSRGNVAIVVSHQGDEDKLTRSLGIITPLSNDFVGAYWMPAESAEIIPVRLSKPDNHSSRLELPPVETAGVLLLARDHEPLISIQVGRACLPYRPLDANSDATFDPHMNLIRLPQSGSASMNVRVFNPASSPLPASQLQISALDGWQLSEDVFELPRIAPAGSAAVALRVTAPKAGLDTEIMYPIVAKLFREGAEMPDICTALVSADIPEAQRPKLLSGNTGYGDSPLVLDTGAEYSYLFPTDPAQTPFSDPCTEPATAGKVGNALTNGPGRGGAWGSFAIFHKADDVDVLFDLKDTYQIERVRVAAGAAAYPVGLKVLVSDDKETWTEAGSIYPEEGQGWWQEHRWMKVERMTGHGRYVRVVVKMPGGGYINEIEIWGRQIGGSS